jgi:hypothetical protein
MKKVVLLTTICFLQMLVFSQAVLTVNNVNVVTTAGTNVVLSGGIALNGTTNLVHNGNMYLLPSTITDDWTDNTGGTGAYNNASTGHVYFRSNNVQNITGASRFYNVTFDNSAGIFLNNTVEVRNTLNLEAGLVNMAATTNLYVSNSALNAVQSTTNYATSWVQGKLRRAAAAAGTGFDGNDYFFPIGKNNTIYAPVRLSKNNNGATNYMAEYFYVPPPDRTNIANPPLDHLSNIEHWQISQDGSFANGLAKVWLSYRTQSLVAASAASRDSLAVAQYINEPPIRWNIPGGWASGNVTGTAAFGFVRANTFYEIVNAASVHRNFALGSLSKINLLPTAQLLLNANLVNQQIQLNWLISNTNNLVNFQIEKALQPQSFTDLFAGAVNNNTYINKTTDINPIQGWNYYRLKTTDNAGKVAYSNIVRVWFSTTDNKILLYPNPANTTVNILLPTNGALAKVIYLYTADGKLVQQMQPIGSLQSINIQHLASGSYFIKVVGAAGNSSTHKFVKQ